MERLQFVAPFRELDPSVLSKHVHPVLAAPVSREVALFTENRHLKSVVCGTAAMLFTWLGSRRRKPRYPPSEPTLRPAEAKGAPPPPPRPPVPVAKKGIPPPPPEAPKDMPKSSSSAPAPKAAEASKTSVPEATSPAAAVPKAAKEVPKSVSSAPPPKAAEAAKEVPKSVSSAPPPKAAEASKTSVPEATSPAAAVPKAATVQKSASADHEAFIAKLEKERANLEKELSEKDAANDILKKQVEELEVCKTDTAELQELNESLLKRLENSAQIQEFKVRLKAAEDKCSAKESEILALEAKQDQDAAKLQELNESLTAAQEKCAAKEAEVFQLQLTKEQALTKVKGLEESLKNLKEESEDVIQLKEVLKKIGEITAPFVAKGQDPSLLQKKAEGAQRRAADLERQNQELLAKLVQNDNELGELRELQQSLAAAEKRAETLSSGVRQIAEQMGATGGGFLSNLFSQPSEDELLRDIQAEIQKLKS